ncbi:MAG: KTSC domain-containing protein [Hyphomicrobiales bacterium]
MHVSCIITKASHVERLSVRSSNLRSVGYDATNSTLEIQFKSGATYQYFGVPITAYQGLMTAASHGAYFDRRIKYTYRYRRV